MGRDDRRRAVVTGMGAITPIGNDVDTFWGNLTAGVSGVARIAAYDPSAEEVQISAEIKGFDPATWMDFKQARRMSRFSQIAVASAAQAIADSGLEITDANREEVGVIIRREGGRGGERLARAVDERFASAKFPFLGDRYIPRIAVQSTAGEITLETGLRHSKPWSVEEKQHLIARGYALLDDVLEQRKVA